MHHYGEDAVSANVHEATFTIEMRHHGTGAAVLVVGPRRGVFEDPDREMDQNAAMELARHLAHAMRAFTPID
jgi:hypothetical protein